MPTTLLSFYVIQEAILTNTRHLWSVVLITVPDIAEVTAKIYMDYDDEHCWQRIQLMQCQINLKLGKLST